MSKSKSIFLLCLVLLAAILPAHGAETSHRSPKTLLQMAGIRAEPAHLSDSVLIIIDAQREYVDGKLPLDGIDASLKEAARALARARKAGTPVIHVVHRGKPGAALFDPNGPYAQIVAAVAPRPDENVVTKTLPNAFADTDLEAQIKRTGRKNLIVIGYMTHMCLSSTVRAALDRGYRTTIVAGASATRDLPDGDGGAIPARVVQRASLAALADRFAAVVSSADDLLE
ncbi:MAG: cysteine hydrolase family protein [Sulfuricella sp.]